METKYWIVLSILLMIIAFVLGCGYGAKLIAEKLIIISADILDIQLSPQARDMLINHPELMSYAIKNYKNVTNPFILSNQRLHYEECVLRNGDEIGCYNGMLSKYGNNTR